MTISADNHALHKPRFCEGSIFRHVVVMAGTGTIGLMAIFIVDFLNLFYISRLGDVRFNAAIGFANALGYLQMAVCIGMSIGAVVITARLIGARKHDQASRIVTSFLISMTLIMLALGVVVAIFRRPILHLLGADGFVLEQAESFVVFVSPCLFLVALGMVVSGLLRSVGDAKRSMNVTIIGAIVAAILDPILILGFHLGIEGAAISTLCSRLAVVLFGFYSLRRYKLLQKPQWNKIISDSYHVFTISFPAILTNLATPVAGVFVIKTMAHFGSDAVSGQTAIDRIVPVAFAFVFALTGSVGPILAQNLGAGLRKRMHETMAVSLKLVVTCVLLGWVFFFVTETWVVQIFALKGEGEVLMRLFCHWIILGNLFLGMLFVSNTAFNNLGYPLLSTAFNWGRATLGTIPFVWIGFHYGPTGIIIGQALGVIPFGLLAVFCAFRVIKTIPMVDPVYNE